jgi:PDZ domain
MRLTMLLAGAATIVALPAAAQDKSSEPGDHAPRADCPAPMRHTISTFFSTRDENRAVLGIGTTSGGPRDTLGLLVTDVTSGGPAEKAGIEEGDRLVAANGTDLRLSAADAGDREMQGLMTRRLIRVLAKLKPGDVATLRVSSEGKVHEVKVPTAKAADLFKDDGMMHLGADWGSGGGMALRHAHERLQDADQMLSNSLGSLRQLVLPDDDSDVQIYVPDAPTPPGAPTAPRARRFMRIAAPTAPVAPTAPEAPAGPRSEITI